MGRPRTEVTANQRRSILARYPKVGYGLVKLAEEIGVSIPVIRRVLTDAKVKLRGRGRPATG